MSPEQCTKGALIDHRSDIYSLAIVLFECLSGRLPFAARMPLEMLEAHIAGKPMPLTAANQSLAACQALSDMLVKAMEKSPDRRHQSIEEFSAELKEAVRRDSIRLSFLKNRKDTLSGVSSLGAPTASSTNPIPALGPNTTGTDMIAMPGDQRFDLSLTSPTHSLPSLEYSGKSAIIASPDALKKDKNIWQALVNTLSNIQPEGEELPADSGKFVFQNCPHCGDPVEPDIAFCLACGRSLTNTQDFSKIRAQQGVFTLPKGADTASTPVPAFSHKTRAVSPVAQGIRQANKSLMLISFILLISIFWVTGGVDFVAKTVAKMMAPQ
jgi:serine/threonine protein kinase